MPRCSVEGCERDPYARNWCKMHYERWRKHGSSDVVLTSWLRVKRPPGPCLVEDCDDRPVTRGYCDKHYVRWWRHGNPTISKIPRGLTLAERFQLYVVIADGCWGWTGYCDTQGYARVRAHGQRGYGAHRLAYELYVGPIPDGLQIDHLCRNPGCVNPAHLEPVTHAENLRRAAAARRAEKRQEVA